MPEGKNLHRGRNRESAMREYLIWKINLVNDMAKDDATASASPHEMKLPRLTPPSSRLTIP
jgi:hypothetical protein